MLLVLGLAVSARPAGRRVKRIWHHWTSVAKWDACRDRPASQRGEPYAWLRIPSAGIDQLVLDGADKERLGYYPCREPVGQATLVMAHRDTHFMGLERLAEGHAIELELRGKIRRRFQVSEIHLVDKADVQSFIHSMQDRDCLLLLTCHPFRHVGPAPRRFIAVATPFGP